MIESQILQAIAKRVEDERLHFQIIVREQELYVYINRDTEDYLDYAELTSTIRTAIAELSDLNLLKMELYSRALGEVEPDWQTSVELTDDNLPQESLESLVEDSDRAVAELESLTDRLEQEIAPTPQLEIDSQNLIKSTSEEQNTSQTVASNNKEAAPEELLVEDFSQYCFIRNQGLLSADLVPPQSTIARLVNTFARFETPIKRSQLPKLESYFKHSQTPDLSSLEPKVKTWWTEIIALNANAKRKLAIWLSRYCFNAETAMAKIETTLAAHTEVQKVSEEKARQQAKEEREARNSAYLESLNTVNESTQQIQSSSSTSNNWISYLLTVFTIKLIGGVIWHYTDFTSVNRTVDQNSLPEVVQDSQHNSQQPAQKARQLFSRGRQKYDRGDFNGALIDLNGAIEIYAQEDSYGNSLEKMHNLRGKVLQNLHDYYLAVEDANRAIDLSPYVSDYYINRSVAYLGMRDYPAAIADQTKAIQLEPKNSYWYFYRGKTHYEARDYDKALPDLDMAITLNSFTIEAYEQRYYTHRALGNLKQAELDYQKAKYFGIEPQQ